jgi:hypothetical protein
MSSSKVLAVEWLNPSTGAVIDEKPVPSGSRSMEFTPPFSGVAVLYLVDTSGHASSRGHLKSREIDTPALLLDLDAMERNLTKMAHFSGNGPTHLRPHYKDW